MEFSYQIILFLFCIAFIAGFIDAIAGGGGLLTIPALLLIGLPPALALGTNKLQATGGSFSASMYFLRKKSVNLKEILLLMLMTFLGASLGTTLIQIINADFIKKVIPVLAFIIGLYFLFTPSLGNIDRKKRVSYSVFAFIMCFPIGFYDGFFGPGTGSIFSLAFISLLGFNLVKATAHAKVLNFTSNIASLILFITGDQIIWTIGLIMMLGQIIGGSLGAKVVLSKGQHLIRPMVVTMSFIMTIKMIYDQGWFG